MPSKETKRNLLIGGTTLGAVVLGAALYNSNREKRRTSGLMENTSQYGHNRDYQFRDAASSPRTSSSQDNSTNSDRNYEATSPSTASYSAQNNSNNYDQAAEERSRDRQQAERNRAFNPSEGLWQDARGAWRTNDSNQPRVRNFPNGDGRLTDDMRAALNAAGIREEW